MTFDADVISALVPGAKRAAGEAGEDAVASGRIGKIALVALADGAGAAPRGGYGARLAVASAIASLEENLASDSPPPLKNTLAAAIAAARQTLSTTVNASAAGKERGEISDLATTLSLAVFGPREIGVASVGDGVHILRDFSGELSFVAMAADTEIANHTDFITAPTLDDKIKVEVLPANEIESLLLSSDGLDSQLVGRRDGERWPLAATADSLLNAPVLDQWDGSDFEQLLRSEVIRRHSDDDCSLALIRRAPASHPGSTEVDGLTLTLASAPVDGRRSWQVAGCANLLAVERRPAAPACTLVAKRTAQVWDRDRRYSPVCWPIRCIGDNLVLLPRTPPKANNAKRALQRAARRQRREIVAGVRACVEAVHSAGVAHGDLTLQCFVLYPDGTIGLWDPGPGMFEGSNRTLCSQRDLEFLARIERAHAARRVAPEFRRGRRSRVTRRSRRGRR